MNGPEAGSSEAQEPLRSSPRPVALAGADGKSASPRESGFTAEDAVAGGSRQQVLGTSSSPPSDSISTSSSTAANTLQIPSNASTATAKSAPRRSVSFGPTVAGGEGTESGSATVSSAGAGTQSTLDNASSSTPAAKSEGAVTMARTDSAKRRARISSEVESRDLSGIQGKTILPLATAAAAATSGASSSTLLSSSESTSAAMGGNVLSSASMTPGASSMSGGSVTGTATPQILKPALKQGIQSKRLPPHGQYQHPDPLLRRLRLVDDKGQSINLRDIFKGVKVVAFYFSSQWAGQPLKEYHQTISELAREHPSELRVIYVSVDVDEQWYKAGVKGQPWVSMVWNDGSSLPSPGVTNATSPSVPIEGDESLSDPPPLHNNEDFLLAQELDIDESLAKTDTSGEAYLRPFSRVHLASKLNIIAAPTVCIYHVERQRMLDWNVRMARLHRNCRDETWARWRLGEKVKRLGFVEALSQSPGTLALLAFALVYWVMILIGGKEWNVSRQCGQQR